MNKLDLEIQYWKGTHLYLGDFLYSHFKEKESEIQRGSDLSQFSSVTQSNPILCDPMDCSAPGFPVHHQLLELAQTHVH